MVKNLTTEKFKELIFDYTQSEEWLFKGKKPAIIDYFSSWCGPCKTIAPILEELDAEYEGIDFYKINTEEQNELVTVFGIRSIPTLLYIPVDGEPRAVMGAMTKQGFKDAIKEIFEIE